jgi:hypothetical protein
MCIPTPVKFKARSSDPLKGLTDAAFIIDIMCIKPFLKVVKV